MNDAIVTFVTQDEDGTVITKVYRLEFESDGNFEQWLLDAGLWTTNIEQLGANKN